MVPLASLDILYSHRLCPLNTMSVTHSIVKPKWLVPSQELPHISGSLEITAVTALSRGKDGPVVNYYVGQMS
jgi:hypothetical protein